MSFIQMTLDIMQRKNPNIVSLTEINRAEDVNISIT